MDLDLQFFCFLPPLYLRAATLLLGLSGISAFISLGLGLTRRVRDVTMTRNRASLTLHVLLIVVCLAYFSALAAYWVGWNLSISRYDEVRRAITPVVLAAWQRETAVRFAAGVVVAVMVLASFKVWYQPTRRPVNGG